LNIVANSKSLLAQSYPQEKFEVLYVDDHSTDGTDALLDTIADGGHIRPVRLSRTAGTGSGKKAAIQKGISEARGELIITSDADCLYPQNWLKTIAENFTAKTGFISAPVAFTEQKTLFGSLQALEFAGLVLTGAGLIGLHNPVICNGANIAYRKSLFKKLDGFSDSKSLSSGDDELVMRKIHQDSTHEIRFLFDAAATVRTAPAASLSAFFRQRARWASKGVHYKRPFVYFALAPIFLFFLMLILVPIHILFTGTFLLPVFLVILSAKAILEYSIISSGKEVLQLKTTLFPFLLAEVLHPVYIVLATVIGAFGFTWKGRELKK
jgi:cellulose synthase/poly-beta-1,6-N-acetylglucosamine synthase-like glycosyltransferase